MNAFFTFAATPMGQALLQEVLALGGTIAQKLVTDVAAMVSAHAATAVTPGPAAATT
jgi:hypothetical protein